MWRRGTPYVTNGERSTTIIEIDVQPQAADLRPRWRRACDCADSPREVARPHRTGFGPYALAPLCGRACYSNAMSAIGPRTGSRGGWASSLPWPPVTLGNSVSRFVPSVRVNWDKPSEYRSSSTRRQFATATTSWRISLKQARPPAPGCGPRHRGCGVTSTSIRSRKEGFGQAIRRDRSRYQLVCTAIAPTRSWPASSRVVWFWRGVGVKRRDFIDCAAGQVALAQCARHDSVT